MKLAARDVERFLDQPEPAVRAVLVYGPDAGLVRERAGRLLRAVLGDVDDPFRLAALTAADVRDDPARLADEMAALSLTGGRRVVRLRGGEARAAEPLRAVLDDDSGGDTLLVLEAGELSPRDGLRKLCEQHKRAAAIACYADDERALEQVVAAALRNAGLEPEPSALAYLVACLGADRGVSRQELEKLILYKAEDADRGVSLADVEACVGDGAPLARDDVALAALSGDQAGLDRALERCYGVGESPIGVLRTVARHLQRLHLLALRARSGTAADEQIRKLRPPVFFKHVPIIRGQLRLWSAPRLAAAMELVTEAELQCKSTGMPAEAVCSRALMRLATAARAGGRTQ